MSSDDDPGTGIHLYDLADGYFCEECRRPKGNRWLLGVPSGCATCDEVISRHRCTGRPPVGERADGNIWECPDCGSAWLVVMAEDTCGHCGRSGMEKEWTLAIPGARLDSAPRYQPHVPVPMRNLLASAGCIASPARTQAQYAAPDSCYSMPSGAMVHVKPGCRC
jgi:hypothetical protein